MGDILQLSTGEFTKIPADLDRGLWTGAGSQTTVDGSEILRSPVEGTVVEIR